MEKRQVCTTHVEIMTVLLEFNQRLPETAVTKKKTMLIQNQLHNLDISAYSFFSSADIFLSPSNNSGFDTNHSEKVKPLGFGVGASTELDIVGLKPELRLNNTN